MMRSLTTAATGMMAQQNNLDTISNNLANVNTNGFKSQRAEFQDIVYQTVIASGTNNGNNATNPTAVQIGLGSKFAANSSNFTQGPLLATGNPLDVAIQGDGFFQIQRPDGTTAYTRDGAFKRDANGTLVTNDGYHVLPEITIPSGATAVSVSANGTVSALVPGSTDPQTVGQIQLATFVNPSGLTRLGQSLYAAGGASGSPVVVNPGDSNSGTLQSGYVEGSNVQVVDEMVHMITAQRAYEINSKAIQTADDMLNVVNSLKR